MEDILSTRTKRTYLKYFMCFVQVYSLLLHVAHAATIIDYLPGYPGKLPFRLETGYIGVGEEKQVQMFYYFIESENDPERDPLLLWLTGGPGCSGLSGLVLEIGPLAFNFSSVSWHTEVPRLEINPYSWTKVASIIFLDSPIGAGFSYATSSEGYYNDDMKTSRLNYDFMKKWLMDYVKFQRNPLYISGDSYSGKIVPVIVKEILNGNKVGVKPLINLKGYILGNPVTEKEDATISRYEFAHRVSLLSDELYESFKISCNGKLHGNKDVGNTTCKNNDQAIQHNIHSLFRCNVLEPACRIPTSHTRCREDNYLLLTIWANNIRVHKALHIREGTKIDWVRCIKTSTSTYKINIESTVNYHRSFTKESIHALVYSGDQDMVVSYVGTLGWIRKLNVPVNDDWRPWVVNGQVAGYTTKYSNDHYHLTYATVKGAGHTAPEYKRQECLHMVTNWLKMYPL